MTTTNPAIETTQLGKQYRLGARRTDASSLRETLARWLRAPLRRARPSGAPPADAASFWALRDVSFAVAPGEVVGIIGRNGAGKSTLLKILARITAPTTGTARIRGRVRCLLEVGTGFHPDLSGRENIYLNGAVLGMRRAEIAAKFDQIVAFAEIERFLDTPVKHYSSGMYVRLAFAVAAHLEPEVLIIDEVLAVGDAAFQKRCLARMEEVRRSGHTILLVSHNMHVISSTCDRVLWLDAGRLRDNGDPAGVVGAYQREACGAGRRAGGRYVRATGPDGREPLLRWAALHDEAGRPCTVFRSGESATLLVETARDLPPATYFEWVLTTEQGVVATSGGTFLAARPLALPTSSGRLRVRIAPLTLAQGTYHLSLRLGVSPGYILDAWEQVDALVITACFPEPGGLPFDARRGVVCVPAHYDDPDDDRLHDAAPELAVAGSAAP